MLFFLSFLAHSQNVLVGTTLEIDGSGFQNYLLAIITEFIFYIVLVGLVLYAFYFLFGIFFHSFFFFFGSIKSVERTRLTIISHRLLIKIDHVLMHVQKISRDCVVT